MYNNIFQSFLNNNNIRHYSRNSSFSVVFAKRFNCTIKELRRPVYERRDSNWVDVMPTITNHNKNRVHTSTKLTPNEASIKKKENYLYQKYYTNESK